MRYDPDEAERNLAAITQAIAAVGLCIPGFVVGKLAAADRSPYVRYWAKASCRWSMIATGLIAASIVLGVQFQTYVALVGIICIHVLFCGMGALAAVFNTPFRYLFVADWFCRNEASVLWYDPKIRRDQDDTPSAQEQADE